MADADDTAPKILELPIGLDATGMRREFDSLGDVLVPAGLLACALLIVNNLRDIRGDTLAGKRTLAVRIGDARSRMAYVLTVLVPFCCAALIAIYRPFALLVALTLPLALVPVRSVRAGASGPALIKALGQTGRLQLAFGIAFAVGLAIHL